MLGMSPVAGHRVRFDLYLDLGAFFQLYFVALRVDEAVRNPNLAIQMICPLYPDLSFFRLSATRMWADDLLHFPRQCCTGFPFL